MSNDTNQEINLALRTAAGHERAALDAEAAASKTYEMKMKSAGASAYSAFALAIRAAPEYQGRKIDDKAISRIYQSNKPRPWWDQHLAKVKVSGAPATREWAKRTILWHMDPEAALARRAHSIASKAAERNRLKEKQKSTGQGARAPQQPSTATMRKMHAAAQDAAHAGRELPSLERVEPAAGHTLQDAQGEINRIKVAVGRLTTTAQFNDAVELLKATARDLEKLA